MELQLKQEINAPADKVWTVLAHQFAEIGSWAPNIKYSRAISHNEVPAQFKVASTAPVPGRVTPNPLGDVTEVLTSYSEENKAFTFKAAGPTPIFSLSVNNTRVVPQGDEQCLVTFDIEFQPKGVFKLFQPLFVRRFKTSPFGPAGIIQDLKTYVENNGEN